MPHRPAPRCRTHPTSILKQPPNRRPVPSQPTSYRPGRLTRLPSLPYLGDLRLRKPLRHRTPPDENPQLSSRCCVHALRRHRLCATGWRLCRPALGGFHGEPLGTVGRTAHVVGCGLVFGCLIATRCRPMPTTCGRAASRTTLCQGTVPRSSSVLDQIGRTFLASSPLLPGPTSNSTV